jgi:galactose mutarotase-like enzyme
LVFLGPRASDISADVPVITANGLFSADRYPIPLAKNVLPLDRALWPQDALCFLDLPVDRLRLDYGDGQLHLHTHNFPHCVLWSRPQAPFIALESWTGYGDPWDFEGELFAKPSMILLPAGGRGQHIASYRFTAG